MSNYINIYQYLMLVWLYHMSMILTEVIPICSPQLQPGVAWQVPIRGRITLVADHVTEFYGCSGRALRSPLANVPANCRATFLCFVTLFWLSLSLLTLLTVQEFPKLWRLGTTCEKRKKSGTAVVASVDVSTSNWLVNCNFHRIACPTFQWKSVASDRSCANHISS